MIFGNPPPERKPERKLDPSPQAPQTSPSPPPRPAPFEGLDTLLTLLMVLNIVVAVFGIISAFAGGGSVGVIVGISCFGGALACRLGRVLIFIAQTLDRIAEQGRGLGQGPQ